jgi:hypothetical protein
MTAHTPRYRVVSDASVLGYFASANRAASYLDNGTLNGVRLREAGCYVESWGITPYWDGDWTRMDPQPKYNPWKREKACNA